MIYPGRLSKAAGSRVTQIPNIIQTDNQNPRTGIIVHVTNDYDIPEIGLISADTQKTHSNIEATQRGRRIKSGHKLRVSKAAEILSRSLLPFVNQPLPQQIARSWEREKGKGLSISCTLPRSISWPTKIKPGCQGVFFYSLEKISSYLDRSPFIFCSQLSPKKNPTSTFYIFIYLVGQSYAIHWSGVSPPAY